MTPTALARHLFAIYEDYRLDAMTPRHCKHGHVVPLLHDLAARSGGLLEISEAGQSTEGRSIHLVTCGKGERKILFWSQMHGDEPTATLALLDTLNFLVQRARHDSWVREMLREVTVQAVPMLNPDGAERVQRRSSCGIDINRDAQAQVTAEAALLRTLQRRLRPRFGFNLHDQELSSVGNTRRVTALALLAPPMDEKRGMPIVRLRAMRVAALIVRSLSQFVDHHIARYKDDFEPRAFGDSMQGWGTSTVLIESGHWPGDREKAFIRRLNFVAILSAARAIGDGSYQDVDLDHYRELPENGKQMFDIIVQDVVVRHPSGARVRADIGLMIEVAHNRFGAKPVVTVKDLGDLSTFGALETIQGGKRPIPAASVVLERVVPLSRFLDELQLYYPV